MKDQRDQRRVLVAIASGAEMRACRLEPADLWVEILAAPGVGVVQTGVGKACAAGGVARVLDPARHSGVISLGVGGAYPSSGLEIGAAVLARQSVFADEGIQTPDGYRSCTEMGFAPTHSGDAIAGDLDWAESLVGRGHQIGTVACVSTCSGTDARADAIAGRTGAVVEAMEGAAVGLVARHVGVHFAEIRVVSNTTGDRDRQLWDLPLALREMGALFDRLVRN